jgi:hypothetical protein
MAEETALFRPLALANGNFIWVPLGLGGSTLGGESELRAAKSIVAVVHHLEEASMALSSSAKAVPAAAEILESVGLWAVEEPPSAVDASKTEPEFSKLQNKS